MADEVISVAITAEEVEQFAADLNRAADSINDLSALDGTAFEGLTVSVNQATEAVDSFSASANDLKSTEAQFSSVETSAEAVAESTNKISASMDKVSKESVAAGQKIATVGKGASESFQLLEGSISRLPPAIQGVVGGFVGLGVAQGVLQTFDALTGFIKSSVSAFFESENATFRLSAALSSLGRYSGQSIDDFRAFASQLQQTTTYEDDATVAAGALIAQLGRLSGDSLISATRAAADFAAVVGVDLVTAANLLAKAAAGNTAALSRYGIVIDEAIPKGERFAAVLNLIETNMGGAAEVQGRTAAGAVSQLTNAWGDLKEQIGALFTLFLPLIRNATAAVQKWNDSLGITASNVLDVDDTIQKLTASIKALDEISKKSKGAIDFGTNVEDLPKTTTTPRKEALEAFSRRFEDLEFSVKFNIQGGTVEEAQRVVDKLNALLAEGAKFQSAELIARIAKLRDEASKQIAFRLEVETERAAADITALRRLAALPVSVEATFLDESVRSRMLELEKFTADVPGPKLQVELPANVDKEIARLQSAIKLQAPKLDDDKFLALAKAASELFVDAFETGVAGSAVDLSKAIKIAPLLKELERQRKLRIDVELALVGPPLEQEVTGPVSRADAELKVLTATVTDLQKTLQVKPSEIIDTSKLGEDVNNLEALRAKLQELAIQLATVAALDPKDPKAIDPSQILAAYETIRSAQAALRQQLGQVSDETASAFNDAADSLDDFAERANDSAAQVNGAYEAASAGIQSATGTAVDFMLGRFETFSEGVTAIFKSMVDSILSQLARMAASWIFKALLNLAAPGTGTAAGLALGSPFGANPPLPGQTVPAPKISPPNFDFFTPSFSLPRERVIERPVDRRPATPADSGITINIRALDGASIRRMVVAGGLRSEIARTVRRSAL